MSDEAGRDDEGNARILISPIPRVAPAELARGESQSAPALLSQSTGYVEQARGRAGFDAGLPSDEAGRDFESTALSQSAPIPHVAPEELDGREPRSVPPLPLHSTEQVDQEHGFDAGLPSDEVGRYGEGSAILEAAPIPLVAPAELAGGEPRSATAFPSQSIGHFEHAGDTNVGQSHVSPHPERFIVSASSLLHCCVSFSVSVLDRKHTVSLESPGLSALEIAAFRSSAWSSEESSVASDDAAKDSTTPRKHGNY